MTVRGRARSCGMLRDAAGSCSPVRALSCDSGSVGFRAAPVGDMVSRAPCRISGAWCHARGSGRAVVGRGRLRATARRTGSGLAAGRVVRTQSGPRHKRFYDSAQWLALRRRVIAEVHGASLYELSLAPSRYVPATCVHHVMRVTEHPEWALSEWAVDGRGRVVRNLIPLSHLGHDVAHGRCGFGVAPRPRPLTDERW